MFYRWVTTLNSNDVADRIIEAVRKNERYTIIPGYFRLMLCLKWVFPWGCISGFLRRLVPDATPQHQIAQSPSIAEQEAMKDNQLNNNTAKTKPDTLLVQRMANTSERVL